ncbi:MAG: transcription-repair coupling factor [Myxococcales bacterium]|nr:MAG: transcription-repair coupling factor [Myxococcales bacterium]
MTAGTATRELTAGFGAQLAAGARPHWRLEGVGEGAAAYVLARLLEGSTRPALIVTAHSRAAEELTIGLQTLTGEKADASFLTRRVHLLPGREAPPLELVSAPTEVEAGRTAALYQLACNRASIVVASVAALVARTLPREALLDRSLCVRVGDDLDLDTLGLRAAALGYRLTGLVEEAGEVAVRGGIIDVWPAGSEYPCRIELFGDDVDSIRYFDPADQRSFNTTEEVVILAVTPFPADSLGDANVRRAVHARCNDLMLAASERRQLDANLADEMRFPGVELMLPYFYDHLTLPADYLPLDGAVAVLDRGAVELAVDDWYEALVDAEKAATDAGTFFPEAMSLYARPEQMRSLFDRRPLIELEPHDPHTPAAAASASPSVYSVDARRNSTIAASRIRVRTRRGDGGFRPMVEELERHRRDGLRVVVLAADPTQLDRIAHLLEHSGVAGVVRADDFPAALAGDPGRLWLVHGHLDSGFALRADALVVVTDEEIFGQRRRHVRRRRVSRQRILTALAQIATGDYMVHSDHGVGIYRGLKRIVVGDTEGDFVHLEYAGGDRYYLPVDRINLVAKYTGAGGGAPALSKLGTPSWSRTKKKARESILKLAHALLEMEAFRAGHTRPSFVERSAVFEEFEARFPFEETDGQKSAVEDVVTDLCGEKPMDRVVCGDVGYGKTEVALRAAYLTIMGGRQAAVLVPTTVLARQHYDTIVKRFEDYPVEVAMLSRFNSGKRNAEVAAGLADGTVDIVVGTHRLLQRDVEFARLGLLVVDEEHRFGVKAKERVKRLRREIDVLTMTATPIPRTLQLSLSGVRDLSLIETPPVDRLAVRTYVARFDEGLAKQALEREISRGGQAFFVHNRVQTIVTAADLIARTVPRARIGIAHGQMRESELERVMLEFLEGEIDVLVCTSIIESGLDIPNANTILVDRADTFGLAQLYQIRGRVGRSHRRAYAYLLVPADRAITEEARKRLQVLRELDDLGSGFRVAAHDMEIRGAGNLLGKQQSGHVAAVGFELFMQMMEEAGRELRGESHIPIVEPEIELGAEAFIPEEYIPDVGERLLLYKRMANARTREDFGALGDEIEDRFGPLPPPVRDFVRVMSLRPALKDLAVESLKASDVAVAFRFHRKSPLDPARLVELGTSRPDRFRLRPGGVLTMALGASAGGGAPADHAGGRWESMVEEIEAVLSMLVGTLEAGA